MKKILALTMAAVMALALCACGGGGGDAASGGESGGTVSLNMATGGTSGTYYGFSGVVAQVLNEKVGDQLILKGNYTGTNPREFADTMWIDEVTEEHLVLKDLGNYSVTYQRKTE